MDRARAVWPELALADDVFFAALADKASSLAGLAQLHTEDLFLATACAAGSVEALIAFEKYLTAVRPALRRIDPSPIFADDVLQLVREKLFVWVGGARPRITDYAATGPLGGWVRVAVLRTALNQKRDHAPRPRDDAGELLGADEPPEVGYLKSRYRGAFQAAFEAAMALLAPAERTLLRLHFVDGLSIDKLAVLEQTSRSTVARRLVELRSRLARATKDELHARLGIAGRELESMVGLLQSQIHLSLARLFSSADSERERSAGR